MTSYHCVQIRKNLPLIQFDGKPCIYAVYWYILYVEFLSNASVESRLIPMPEDTKVTVIPPIRKFGSRVDIYCRVSTKSTEQLESLSNQASYLTRLVAVKPGWTLADVYLDVKSGAEADNRSEFHRLIEDCRSKKIDIVLTKSISRFGRNTAAILRQ